MLVNIPESNAYRETALSIINLACDILFNYFHRIGVADFHPLTEISKEELLEADVEAFMTELRTASSLIQQSMEMLLKARICDVSPFLLISERNGEWRSSWSSPDTPVDFSDLRTIDAKDLVNAVGALRGKELSRPFRDWFDEQRKVRNKLTHGPHSNIRMEASNLLKDALLHIRELEPAIDWLEIRRRHHESKEAIDRFFMDCENAFILAIANELSAFKKLYDVDFFESIAGIDPAAATLYCPTCYMYSADFVSHLDIPYAHFTDNTKSEIRCLLCGINSKCKVSRCSQCNVESVIAELNDDPSESVCTNCGASQD